MRWRSVILRRHVLTGRSLASWFGILLRISFGIALLGSHMCARTRRHSSKAPNAPLPQACNLCACRRTCVQSRFRETLWISPPNSAAAEVACFGKWYVWCRLTFNTGTLTRSVTRARATQKCTWMRLCTGVSTGMLRMRSCVLSRAYPQIGCSGIWCFRMWGFKIVFLKLLTHISLGCEVPTPSVFEGQSTAIFKPHILKHHIPELLNRLASRTHTPTPGICSLLFPWCGWGGGSLTL